MPRMIIAVASPMKIGAMRNTPKMSAVMTLCMNGFTVLVSWLQQQKNKKIQKASGIHLNEVTDALEKYTNHQIVQLTRS